MGDPLTRLVQRTLGMAPVVRPVLAPLYAPGPVTAGGDLPASTEALSGQERDTALPPEDASGIPPVGTPPRTLFAPAALDAPRGGDERLEPGPSAPLDPSRGTPRRHSESRAEEGPMTAPSELREADRAGKPSAVSAVLESPSAVLAPPSPDQPIPTSIAGTEPVSPVPEDALLSSPGGLPVQQILRPRVVLSESQPPSAVESPTKGDRRRGSPEPATAASTIRVTIGRVEVRANLPPAAAPHSKPARPGPMLSLDDYLKQRDGGHR